MRLLVLMRCFCRRISQNKRALPEGGSLCIWRLFPNYALFPGQRDQRCSRSIANCPRSEAYMQNDSPAKLRVYQHKMKFLYRARGVFNNRCHAAHALLALTVGTFPCRRAACQALTSWRSEGRSRALCALWHRRFRRQQTCSCL